MHRVVMLIVLVCALAPAALAQSKSLVSPRKAEVLNAQSIKRDPAFSEDGGSGASPVADYKSALSEYKADKATLVTRIDGYDADYIVMTNKIADATTTAKCKTALEKTQKAIEAQQREILALKQMVSDLKKMEKAAIELE